MKNQLVFLLGLNLFLWSALAHADFYQYTDEKGRLQMTNRLEKVPSRYRAKMKVIKEIPPKSNNPLPREDVNEVIEQPKKISQVVENYPEEENEEIVPVGKEKTVKEMETLQKQEIVTKVKDRTGVLDKITPPAGSKTISVVLYFVAVILSYIFFSKYLKRWRLNIVIFLLLSGLLSIYLLRTYAEKTHQSYTELKKKTQEIQEKMGKRTKERMKIMEDLKQSAEENVN